MRTNINLACDLDKLYPDRNKNKWAESLKHGDIIAVDGKPVVYLSHDTYQASNGMGGYYLHTEFEIISSQDSIDKLTHIVNDLVNEIEPITK